VRERGIYSDGGGKAGKAQPKDLIANENSLILFNSELIYNVG
jgi:hypothetical protein